MFSHDYLEVNHDNEYPRTGNPRLIGLVVVILAIAVVVLLVLGSGCASALSANGGDGTTSAVGASAPEERSEETDAGSEAEAEEPTEEVAEESVDEESESIEEEPAEEASNPAEDVADGSESPSDNDQPVVDEGNDDEVGADENAATDEFTPPANDFSVPATNVVVPTSPVAGVSFQDAAQGGTDLSVVGPEGILVAEVGECTFPVNGTVVSDQSFSITTDGVIDGEPSMVNGEPWVDYVLYNDGNSGTVTVTGLPTNQTRVCFPAVPLGTDWFDNHTNQLVFRNGTMIHNVNENKEVADAVLVNTITADGERGTAVINSGDICDDGLALFSPNGISTWTDPGYFPVFPVAVGADFVSSSDAAVLYIETGNHVHVVQTMPTDGSTDPEYTSGGAIFGFSNATSGQITVTVATGYSTQSASQNVHGCSQINDLEGTLQKAQTWHRPQSANTGDTKPIYGVMQVTDAGIVIVDTIILDGYRLTVNGAPQASITAPGVALQLDSVPTAATDFSAPMADASTVSVYEGTVVEDVRRDMVNQTVEGTAPQTAQAPPVSSGATDDCGRDRASGNPASKTTWSSDAIQVQFAFADGSSYVLNQTQAASGYAEPGVTVTFLTAQLGNVTVCDNPTTEGHLRLDSADKPCHYDVYADGTYAVVKGNANRVALAG